MLLMWVALSSAVFPARADETPNPPPAAPLSIAEQSIQIVDRTIDGVQTTLDQAFEYLGIRYKRGGSTPETGFDCSGFVRHVYNESIGLLLPRSAKDISKEGERVEKAELQPGDLVFFNTMRRTFSHVGIYLGNNQFIHSPRAGGRVRVEDMSDKYWSRRYNGARRVQP